MKRATIIVLDSVGIGGAEDGAAFGDLGSNTLGHIAAACRAGMGDREGLRSGPLRLPNLDGLGLSGALKASSGADFTFGGSAPTGLWGYGIETSKGKDTPSGHWDIAGVPVPWEWGYFPETEPCFPKELTDAVIAQGKLPGILGNKHASGTVIIEELGEEHIRTGKPICYTSADSVFQIAAHETHFGLERLYDLCKIVRKLCDPLNIGRVIARPFVGETAATFQRTANRHDYTIPPPEPTILDRVVASGHRTFAVGKIKDIFAGRGVTEHLTAKNNDGMFDAMLKSFGAAGDGDLVFANFVDFDTEYGHRRDVPGYAAALEAFDRRLSEFVARLRPGDFAIITADHGNDPTWKGTDHTREHTPILAFGPGFASRALGGRRFADMGESVAAHLGLAPGRHGRSFL
jgi:phosphopentomutase